MSQIEEIQLHGTSKGYRSTRNNKITCADGFTMSVIAGAGVYCSPRPDGYGPDAVDHSYEGPYLAAEVGFPSERPEPWADWEPFCESPDAPTETVYGYVPFAVIRALIDLHGGEK